MAIKFGNVPGNLEIFLRIFGLMDFNFHQRCSNMNWDRFLSRMWTVFWFVLNIQSFFYYFVKLALPEWNQIFLENIKGVRSQMSSFAAFLAFTTRATAGLICHSILILTLRGTFHQLEEIVQIDKNRPEFRRWSTIAILCILLSV